MNWLIRVGEGLYCLAVGILFIIELVIIVVFFVWVAHASERPARWCGWYARTHLASNDPGPDYNQACEWLHYGQPTSAHEGAMVIWCSRNHRHVGKITGPCQGDECVVTSGNDSHAVRTRLRSVAGAQFRE